jgi:hypothetical protein
MECGIRIEFRISRNFRCLGCMSWSGLRVRRGRGLWVSAQFFWSIESILWRGASSDRNGKSISRGFV